MISRVVPPCWRIPNASLVESDDTDPKVEQRKRKRDETVSFVDEIHRSDEDVSNDTALQEWAFEASDPEQARLVSSFGTREIIYSLPSFPRVAASITRPFVCRTRAFECRLGLRHCKTAWNRRAQTPHHFHCVVDIRRTPRASMGLRRLAASRAPSVFPAPSTRWDLVNDQ